MIDICQMVEDIGKEFDVEIIKIEAIDPMNMPIGRKEIGIYFIFTRKGTYLGSSINIFKRLRANIVDGNLCRKNLEVIRSINVYITNREEDARILEYVLLDKIKPMLNIRKGFGSEKYNYRENWNLDGKEKIEKIEKPSGIWRPEVWRRYKKLNIM